MRFLVWLLVALAVAVGLFGYSHRYGWRNRGSYFGSFDWWKRSRHAKGGWWW